MARKKKASIKIKPSRRGRLRKSAGVKKGNKIPLAKLRQMKKSKNPKTRRRATFALNARKWGKKRRRRS
jgi:oligoendopeptidase F